MKWGRMWKEAVMEYFQVMSKHLPWGIEEKMRNLSQKACLQVEN
jgi:hypothetical protein